MLRTVWVVCVLAGMTVLLGIPVILLSFVDPSGRSLHVLARIWARAVLAAAGVRVVVRGLEHLDGSGPRILAANHQGVFDIFALMAYLPVRFGWIAKKELYRIPLFGLAMRRFGNVCVDRSRRDRALRSLKLAAERIRGGLSIIIFPEGTRSPDGRVHAFKKGCFHLAAAAGVPVVPASISGSFQVLPKNGRRVRPGTIHVVLGPPLYASGDSPAERDAFLERLRAEVVRNQVPAPAPPA